MFFWFSSILKNFIFLSTVANGISNDLSLTLTVKSDFLNYENIRFLNQIRN